MFRPPTGKLTPESFAALIAPHLGAARAEVLVGPRAGCDAAIIRVGAGRVLAVTTDPLSLIPVLGPERSARLACNLLASDLWTTGIAPAWATVSLNLPPHLDDATLGAYARAMSDEWTRLGVAVVAGHTGRYEGCDLTIVGAATLMGLGDETRYLSPAMARPGDRVIVTKGCAIEATAIAAQLFPKRLAARLADLLARGVAAGAAGGGGAASATGGAGTADDIMNRARALIEQVSVVPDCIAALRAGVREDGVTALHDATEGGVLGGLVELAKACGHDLRVERSAIPLSLEARAACGAFGIDPYWALAEGALIVCARPARVAAVLAELAAEGIMAAAVGEVLEGGDGGADAGSRSISPGHIGTPGLTGSSRGALRIVEPDGSETLVDRAEPDPYWDAYARAVRERWE